MSVDTVREQAQLIGPRRSLVGIISPPADGAPARDVTVVILNSGVIHRVGANRLHVTLARQLSRAGFRVLRFDLSGIGDSLTRTDASASLLEAAMKDIREAVDHVAGPDGRVALMGLCSGAGQALLYAPRDERVSALVLLDLWIPRTRGYHWRRTWKRLTNRRSWTSLIMGRHPRVRTVMNALTDWSRTSKSASNGAAPAPAQDPESGITEAEARGLLAAAFPPLIERRVEMLTVFTAGLENQHNYPMQLFDAFAEIDFRDRVQLEWFASSDHTFSSDDDQNRLRSLIVSWLETAAGERTVHATSVRSVLSAAWVAISSGVSYLFSALIGLLLL